MPQRLRDLKRALALLGVAIEPARGGGSHWRAVRGGRVYPVPAHNGERSEVKEAYLRGLCRVLELDEAELRKLLG